MHALAGLVWLLLQSDTPKPWIWRESRPEPLPPRTRAEFGRRVAVLDDLDGDGVPDVAITAPLESSTMAEAGCVDVVSGADGHRIAKCSGTSPGERLGTSLSRCPDFDRDGSDDLLVGFAGSSSRLVSSRTGEVLGTFRNRTSIAAEDLDGDGVPDLVSGGLATWRDATGDYEEARTVVRAESGCDDHEIYRIYGGTVTPGWIEGGSVTDGFGSSICFLGDLDGDGTADFVASVPRRTECRLRFPAIRFLSGRSGAEIHSVRLEGAIDRSIPLTLTRAGDIDRDGTLDLLVSSGGEGCGLVISGRTGAVLRTLRSRRHLRDGAEGFESGCVVGDLDGDGTPEWAVARDDLFGEDGGVEIFSGADGHSLRWLSVDGRSATVGEGRDFDADGIPDLVVGLPENDEVVVLSGRALGSLSPDGAVPRAEWPQLLAYRLEGPVR